jgi:hypothetical protein
MPWLPIGASITKAGKFFPVELHHDRRGSFLLLREVLENRLKSAALSEVFRMDRRSGTAWRGICKLSW